MSKSMTDSSHEDSKGSNNRKPWGHRIRPRSNFISILLLSTLFVSTALLAGSACITSSAVTAYEDSFTVGESATLIVKTFVGWIHVEAASDNHVHVETKLRDSHKLKYEAYQNSEVVTVNVERTGLWWFPRGSSAKADVCVTAPVGMALRLETSNGDIEITDMNNGGSLITSNGKIILNNVKGDFDVRTSNGAVELREGKGIFDASTSNGDIFFSGEMTPGGNNRFTTSNGDVTVELKGIPSVNLDASTSNGKVKCEPPILATETETDHLMGKIGAGEADLYIKTSNGDVTIK